MGMNEGDREAAFNEVAGTKNSAPASGGAEKGETYYAD